MRRIFEDEHGNKIEQLDLWDYGYDARTRGWYRDTMRADRALVSSPYASFSIGTPMITLSAPLRGQVQGVIATDLKLDKFSDWVHAQTVLEKSSELEPNQARVLAALGMALCNQKTYEAAIPKLEKSLQLDPTEGWETEWALAKSYYYHEQYDQALKMAQQAQADSHGLAPQVELLLAQCLTAAERFEDAAGVLRAVLKNNATSPEATTARRWLERLTADGKIRPTSASSP